MVLVDTSVWIAHFREGHPGLTDLLLNGNVSSHSFVIGELACGNLKDRKQILSLLKEIPRVIPVAEEEIISFIETHQLAGKGLGLVDVHLLASALLSNVELWTLDKILLTAAQKLNIAYKNH